MNTFVTLLVGCSAFVIVLVYWRVDSIGMDGF